MVDRIFARRRLARPVEAFLVDLNEERGAQYELWRWTER
jgi:hypothetical protein